MKIFQTAFFILYLILVFQLNLSYSARSKVSISRDEPYDLFGPDFMINDIDKNTASLREGSKDSLSQNIRSNQKRSQFSSQSQTMSDPNISQFARKINIPLDSLDKVSKGAEQYAGSLTPGMSDQFSVHHKKNKNRVSKNENKNKQISNKQSSSSHESKSGDNEIKFMFESDPGSVDTISKFMNKNSPKGLPLDLSLTPEKNVEINAEKNAKKNAKQPKVHFITPLRDNEFPINIETTNKSNANGNQIFVNKIEIINKTAIINRNQNQNQQQAIQANSITKNNKPPNELLEQYLNLEKEVLVRLAKNKENERYKEKINAIQEIESIDQSMNSSHYENEFEKSLSKKQSSSSQKSKASEKASSSKHSSSSQKSKANEEGSSEEDSSAVGKHFMEKKTYIKIENKTYIYNNNGKAVDIVETFSNVSMDKIADNNAYIGTVRSSSFKPYNLFSDNTEKISKETSKKKGEENSMLSASAFDSSIESIQKENESNRKKKINNYDDIRLHAVDLYPETVYKKVKSINSKEFQKQSAQFRKAESRQVVEIAKFLAEHNLKSQISSFLGNGTTFVVFDCNHPSYYNENGIKVIFQNHLLNYEVERLKKKPKNSLIDCYLTKSQKKENGVWKFKTESSLRQLAIQLKNGTRGLYLLDDDVTIKTKLINALPKVNDQNDEKDVNSPELNQNNNIHRNFVKYQSKIIYFTQMMLKILRLQHHPDHYIPETTLEPIKFNSYNEIVISDEIRKDRENQTKNILNNRNLTERVKRKIFYDNFSYFLYNCENPSYLDSASKYKRNVEFRIKNEIYLKMIQSLGKCDPNGDKLWKMKAEYNSEGIVTYLLINLQNSALLEWKYPTELPRTKTCHSLMKFLNHPYYQFKDKYQKPKECK